eukprot:TRINITY_DN77444_c0_g1_i1.p1 TRINITY_DN77444_c0_g1~~TRINITY_DN77444_c0_g1_i1.p1  ORF type:complete len:279 (-),score=60.16 TRINITY_DN77444_c0_g1_i1:66-902(-)
MKHDHLVGADAGIEALLRETSNSKLGSDVRGLTEAAAELRSLVDSNLRADRVSTLTVQDVPDYLGPVATQLEDVLRTAKATRTRLTDIANAAATLQEQSKLQSMANMERDMAHIRASEEARRTKAAEALQEALKQIQSSKNSGQDAQSSSSTATKLSETVAHVLAREPVLRDPRQIVPRPVEAVSSHAHEAVGRAALPLVPTDLVVAVESARDIGLSFLQKEVRFADAHMLMRRRPLRLLSSPSPQHQLPQRCTGSTRQQRGNCVGGVFAPTLIGDFL